MECNCKRCNLEASKGPAQCWPFAATAESFRRRSVGVEGSHDTKEVGCITAEGAAA